MFAIYKMLVILIWIALWAFWAVRVEPFYGSLIPWSVLFIVLLYLFVSDSMV